MLIFDLETGPLSDDQLRSIYQEPTWDEFSASCDQRWKEETKRAKFDEAKASGWQSFADRAALSPITGRVLAIGFRSTENGKLAIEDGGGDEEDLLNRFWAQYCKCKANPGGPRKLAGWNIFGFDLPFLIRRSWFYGIAIPSDVRDPNDRYWHPLFVDLMQRFAVGAWKENVKLDMAARFFGCGEKNGHGADFSRLWFGTADEKQQAVAYLRNDLEMTAAIGQRMGLA